NFPSGVRVLDEHLGFTVIAAPRDVIDQLRQHYPVGPVTQGIGRRLGFGSNRIAHADVTSEARRRDVGMSEKIVQFVAPMRDAWRKRLEEAGAKILYPLGGSS